MNNTTFTPHNTISPLMARDLYHRTSTGYMNEEDFCTYYPRKHAASIAQELCIAAYTLEHKRIALLETLG